MSTVPGTLNTSADISPVPRIFPRSGHPISRKNIDREALKVLYRLRDAGHVAYLVGGGVRDLYLGKTPKDFDISTDARPGQLRKIFRNSRLIGRRFKLVQIFFHGGKIIEVSTFRCRSEFDLNGAASAAPENILAANNTYGTPSDDAFRRDLTINGLFYEIENKTIIDYTNGVKDLEQGIIRLIGEPTRRVQRDPVRMMRIIRHAARNNFTIDPRTWEAIISHRDKLTLCPISRIRDELMKDLRSSACLAWTQLAVDSGIFNVLFPFYQPLIDPAVNGKVREMLLALQAVVARLQTGEVKLPDQLIFSLVLLPWAVAEYDFLHKNIKGAEFHRFRHTIRDRLDQILGPLSVKRAHKESIALHLTTLPQFIRFSKENSWPKWLKRKSYYRECDLFFRIFSEASGAKRVPDTLVAESVPPITVSTRHKPSRKRRHKKRSGSGPAFSSKKKGGIFGLKK
ncbi:MAG: poly(A) polymerase [Desulfobulbales bacterium]